MEEQEVRELGQEDNSGLFIEVEWLVFCFRFCFKFVVVSVFQLGEQQQFRVRMIILYFIEYRFGLFFVLIYLVFKIIIGYMYYYYFQR